MDKARYIKLLQIFFLLAAVTMLNFIWCGVLIAEDSAQEFISRGLEKAMNNKDYYGAISTYEKGLKKFPKSYELYFCIGCAYKNLEKYSLAIENIIQSARLSGGFSCEMHEALVKCYYGIGKQRRFTRETCLRLIYHTMKVLELKPELEEAPLVMKGLKDDLEYLDKTSLGGVSYVLPLDIVDEKSKLQHVDMARKKLERYQKEQKKGLPENEALQKAE